jgi:hypothetical protein
MLRMYVYMHSRFVENHLIRILKDGPLISEVVLSHRIEAWRVERAVREWADGPFLVLGRIAAWRAERGVRERADGPFLFSGQIRVMNSTFHNFFSVQKLFKFQI